MTLTPMRAVHDAIAESNNELGGFSITRLTVSVAEGVTIFPVETTFGWQDSGKFVCRGVAYTYASKTLTSLEGVEWVDGDTTYTGAAANLVQETPVVDYTRATSAIDLLRRSLLVDYAEGSDLSDLGRGLGVFRLPSISSDTVFRAIIKALAYNPRGTLYGIELFLEAALGAGNYTIFEDLVNHPNEVFITLVGGASLVNQFVGKAYLTPFEYQPATGAASLDVSEAPLRVIRVMLKDTDYVGDFRLQKPSADTVVEYTGDPGTTYWTYQGPSEAADVTVLASGEIEIADTSGADVARYGHIVRINDKSFCSVGLLTYLDSTSTFSQTLASQWGAQIRDGAYALGWGVQDDGAGGFNIGLTDGGDSFLSGVAANLDYDQYYDIEIRKYGTDHVELLVDGAVVQTLTYATFTTVTVYEQIIFGSSSTTQATHKGRIKEIRLFSTTPQDFWAASGISAAVAAGDPDQVDINDPILTAGDVGKRLILSGGTTTNPQGGTNNGTFEVLSVDSTDRATVQGELNTDGFVETAFGTRFNAASRVFQYPDDLGKQIVISGSDNNDGARVISQLIDPDDGVTDLASYATAFPVKTNIAIVTGGSPYITETGLEFRVGPVFVTESGLEWNLSDMGSVAGVTLTLSQNLPVLSGQWGSTPTVILNAVFDRVLSAQVLLGLAVRNLTLDADNQIYTHYPFYLSDPFGYLLAYLDVITAAGVIPRITTV